MTVTMGDKMPRFRTKNFITIVCLCIFSIGLLGCREMPVEPTDTPRPPTSTATQPTAVAVASPTGTPTPVMEATPESLSPEDRRATRRAERQTSTAAAPDSSAMTTSEPAERHSEAATPAPTSESVEPLVTVEPEPMIPLIDMGEATYFGFEGGLYPGGANEMPAEHAQEGLQRALAIQPLANDGSPDPDGNYIMLSVGLSNTGMEFCRGLGVGHDYNTPCTSYSFMGQSAVDPAVNHDELVILSGARGGQTATRWASPSHENYDRILNDLLLTRDLSEQQVQVIWLKVVNDIADKPSLPWEEADAFSLMATLADVVRALKVRYPNLQQVFLSSRIYGGYAVRTELNPEPYAYESGFAVKWLIEAQIEQMGGGEIDPLAGDLNYNTVAPWLAWGPYLWANGTTPRSDGLVWVRQDFANDGVHPAESGRTKVANMLLDFFKTSRFTPCWFTTGGSCE